MIPKNLTPTTIKMIPRVLPNQKERFETEEIFKRNAQTSEASKHFLTYSEIKVYFYFCCKHLNFFCGEKQLLCHMYVYEKQEFMDINYSVFIYRNRATTSRAHYSKNNFSAQILPH